MPDDFSPAARRRLGLVLARLSSEHDGEALNAARLACRILAEHKIRPEALAGWVGEPPRAEPKREPPPKEEPRRRSGFNTGGGSSSRSRPADEDEVEPVTDCADFAEQLLDHADAERRLSRSDLNFLSDLVDRGWHGAASPRQAKWLRDIEAKLTDPYRRRHA